MDERNTRRRPVLRSLATASIVGTAGCARLGLIGDSTFEAAWLYVGHVGDFGWSWAHDQGRRAVDEQFDWLETDYTPLVANDAVYEEATSYLDEDFDVVIGTSFGFGEELMEVAADYPDKTFLHCAGFESRENLGVYFGRIYQSRYLTGVAAGMLTETNTLGYLGAFPISEVIRGLNAYALGARSVNDDVTVKTAYTNSWYDEDEESALARDLVDEGIDVMAQHQDSPAAIKTASANGIWGTGYNSPMQDFAGRNYVTSPVWNWEEYYGPILADIREGTWDNSLWWEGLDSGLIDIDDWGPNVPQDVRDEVARTREAIESGELDIWEGTTFENYSEDELFQEVEEYVDPVEGSPPSGG